MSRPGKVILYLAYFVIVAVLCGFIITSSKSKSPKVAKVPVPTQHKPPQKPATPAKPAVPKPPAPPAARKKAPSASPTPVARTPAASPGSSSLVNTGPGEVVGLFVAATATGALAYRYVLIRRLSQ